LIANPEILKMATQKSPAQVLFDRLMRTWIIPAANERGRKTGHQIVLRIALVIWDGVGSPSVYFNEEVHGKVIKIKLVAAGQINKGQPVFPSNLKGISKVMLRHGIHDFPYILVLQGQNQRFFVASSKVQDIVGTQEFKLLAKPLGTEGVELTLHDSTFDIFLDVIRNAYVGMTPAHKRREIRQLARLDVERVRTDAIPRARRHLRLPAFIALQEDEFLPLLIEARQAYISGHFFSCIATGITTADRICNRLARRYGLPPTTQKALFRMTFGQKIDNLHASGVITDSLRSILIKMNMIRNRHLHPKEPLRQLTLKRDGLKILRLLHEFLEGTFSVFRDYRIENGKFVPKPLI
jgi:hypothetical protein